VTKEEFLTNPFDYLFGPEPSTPIPAEWFREAWETNSAFREEVIYGVADNVRKTGSICAPSKCVDLSRCLSAEQALSLYESLRDGVDRSETEWRAEFQQEFPQCADQLPPINRARVCYYLTYGLFTAMKRRAYPRIRPLLSEFKLWGITLNEAKLVVIEIMEVAVFKCFDGAADDAVFSVLQVAEAEGMTEVATLLREAGATE
jgi:hypothetical protein